MKKTPSHFKQQKAGLSSILWATGLMQALPPYPAFLTFSRHHLLPLGLQGWSQAALIFYLQ